jgi:hypothetical protein
MLDTVFATLDQSTNQVLQFLQEHIVLATGIATGTSSAGAIVIVCIVVYKLHQERRQQSRAN